MKLLRCPKCHARELESFPGYAYCHACHGIDMTLAKRSRNGGQPKEKLLSLAKRRKTRGLANPIVRALLQKPFTERDYAIVRNALLSIPKRSRRIVVMHFWNNIPIEEVAARLNLNSDRIIWVLSCAYSRLRRICLTDPGFSRFPAQESRKNAA